MNHALPPKPPGAVRRAAPRPIPGAAGIVVVISGKSLGSDGVTYDYLGSVTLTPRAPTPTPIPVPTPAPTPTPLPGPTATVIIGIRNLATGQRVTSATAGTSLVLEGSGLGTGGRLQLAGRVVAVPLSWSPTRIVFPAPDPGAVPLTGGWDLFWPTATGFTFRATTGAFTLLPGSGPAPVPIPGPTPLPAADMTVFGYRNGGHAEANTFAPGQTIFIEGKGFGAIPGTVSVNHARVEPVTWSDTEIQLLCPALPTAAVGGPAALDIVRADHGSYDSSKAFVILAPPGTKEKERVPF